MHLHRSRAEYPEMSLRIDDHTTPTVGGHTGLAGGTDTGIGTGTGATDFERGGGDNDEDEDKDEDGDGFVGVDCPVASGASG